jgi:hypothetical protein
VTDVPTTFGVPEPNELTGEFVEKMRTAYHVSKMDFMTMCGFEAKSPARIYNIERKNSWKPGDREKVHAALSNMVINPPKGKFGRQRGESGSERAERLDRALRNAGIHADGGDVDPKDDAGPVLLDVSVDLDDLMVTDIYPSVPIAEEHSTHVLNPTEDGYGYSAGDEWDDDGESHADDGLKQLTNSEVSVWQRCRRKWWLAVYRQLGLAQVDYMGYRAIGGRVHRALAAWYVPEGQERTDPREALERVIVEDWTALAAQVRARPSYGDSEQTIADLSARFNDAVSLERAMIEGYVQWMAENGDDANLRVIAPETEMSAVIEGEVADEHVVFRARALLDVRLRRVTDGARLFEDHKTVGNFADKIKLLRQDPQMLHYHLLEFLNSSEGDERCDGALYNMLRRVKRTAKAKPPFYERVEVHHNSIEIDSYRRRLLGVARDIMRAERELAAGGDPLSIVYPHPTGDCSWDCDFYAICHMLDDGSRVEDALSALYVIQDPMARYDTQGS